LLVLIAISTAPTDPQVTTLQEAGRITYRHATVRIHDRGGLEAAAGGLLCSYSVSIRSPFTRVRRGSADTRHPTVRAGRCYVNHFHRWDRGRSS